MQGMEDNNRSKSRTFLLVWWYSSIMLWKHLESTEWQYCWFSLECNESFFKVTVWFLYYDSSAYLIICRNRTQHTDRFLHSHFPWNFFSDCPLVHWSVNCWSSYCGGVVWEVLRLFILIWGTMILLTEQEQIFMRNDGGVRNS